MKSKNQNIEDVYPLSPMQQGMLFHSIFAPASGVYLGQITYELHGDLDILALELAWQQVIERHSILRTAFVWQNVEKSIQVVGRSVKLPLLKHDWCELSVSQRQQQLEEFLQTDRHQDFGLSKAPLIRLNLIKLSDELYYLILTHHHLVLDGWSLPLLFGEVIACYEALRRGQKLSLSRPIPYRHYIAWLQKQDISQAEKFWQKYLQGFTAPTPLVLEENSHNFVNHNKNAVGQDLWLSPETTSKLQAFARKHRLTLNTIVQAAWALLLSRYSNEKDVVFGATSSGRPVDLVGAETMIGNLINTLPVRVQIDFQESILSCMQRLQVEQIESRQYEYSPLINIQAWSQVHRGVPLFESIVVFENYPNDASLAEQIGDLQIRKLNSILETNYPLTVTIGVFPNFYLNILYDCDRFNDATITRMLGHLQTILVNIIANPEQRLADLPLLTEAELHQLLKEWNNTSQEYPLDKCIHQLFAEQVERTPDAVAVVFENQQLTYRQLNQQANQLAHYLQKLGVGPEVLVGICVERSPLMLVGLLAILKAGGVYVPLDPSYPSERLAWMIEDSQLSVVLTQSHLRLELSKYQTKVVCLDNDWDTIAQECDVHPDVKVTPDNLAYIIYTSGSTGKPKGVMVEHKSLLNYTQAAIEEYEISSSDRILQFASISFDASAEEIFPCLVQGATLVLRTDEMLNSVANFLEKCQEQALTVLDLPTAFWHQLTSELPALRLTLPASLRLVIIGGEKASPDKVSTWQQSIDSKVKLVNSYGPTEATVVATTCDLSGQTFTQEIPIGKAIANIQTYILDTYLQPVPIGVSGELYIGGKGVARGYLNQPQLTAEKFIPNPFSLEVNSRLYKTGDLVRYRSDGKIEIIGRVDHQVKIRGFRIELGEIEAVLSQHPAVQASVVIAEEQRIIAYWVAKQQPAPAISELRHFIGQNLPQYMIPATFVQLAALPLTPNGKVDKKALPVPDYVRPELDQQFIAPRTPVESKLAQIWSEVLRVEQVGIYDNFFDLGGDSILTIQIIAKANQVNLQLTPKQLFQHQNIAELAGVCFTCEATLPEQGLITGTVPLTSIQHWFFEQNYVNPHHDNQAVLLEVQQKLDLQLLNQALQQLVIHHDALRLRFEQKESAWQQFHASADDTVSFSSIDLSEIPQDEQKTVLEAAANELQASLNLFQGPLLKAALFNLGTQQHSCLLVAIHHLVVDAVSWRILLDDLETAYAQLSQGETIKLPTKTTSFKKWSEKLQEYANSTAAQKELDYWLAIANKQVSSVPIDFPGGANTIASTSVLSVKLSVEETTLLLKEVPSAYRTQINDVLLTALVQAFANWTGDKSLLIHVEGHGREDIFDDVYLSRTVGWFTSLFPVLLDIRETSSVGEALKAVKEQLRAIPNRGIGYGILRYNCENTAIKESLQIPQSEVVFNYLGQFDQTLAESSLFKFATDSCGATRSLQNNRNELLEINSLVVDDQLQIDWTYSQTLHSRSTIAVLSEGFVDALRSLITHCTSPEAGGYTPSDFPLAKTNQQQLDDLLQKQQQIEDIYPLSPMQQGMLFYALYDQNSAAYVTQTSCILRGKLNLSAFKQAWQQLIQRHTILRTAFHWEGLDTPLQVVLKDIDLPYQQQDWRELTPNEQQTRLDILLQTDYTQSFNLASAPLMRLILIQLADDTYQFIWSSHHLLLDGWSTPLLLQEVFVLYQGSCRNQLPFLEKVRPYRDYIAWLQQQDLLEAQNFWRRILKGFTAPTDFGINRNSLKSTDEKQDFYEQEFKLSLAKSTSLQLFAKQYQLTLNTVIQGAWALLLSHYSGNKDVIFGATVSNRPVTITGVESMIGLFINTLPVRVQILDCENLVSWLQQIQSQQVETRQYEYTPLADVHKCSEVPQGIPLFESVMVFENFPKNSFLQDELGLEFDDSQTIIRNHYPLTLRVQPSSELSLDIMCDRRCLEPYTITKITNHFEILLSQFVNQPDIQIKELVNLLTVTDQKQQIAKEQELEKVSLQKFRQTKRKAIRNSY
jgi:amino acid adenylation domain-containing protein/non-ribosomal peptide synthase protein (TIGR01720 family)